MPETVIRRVYRWYRYCIARVSFTIKKQNHEINPVHYSSHPHYRVGYRNFCLRCGRANPYFISDRRYRLNPGFPAARYHRNIILSRQISAVEQGPVCKTGRVYYFIRYTGKQANRRPPSLLNKKKEELCHG